MMCDASVRRISLSPLSFLFFFKDFIYLFLERGERKEREKERNINVWLPLTRPLVGTWPTTQACALTGNWTSNLWFTACTQSTKLHQPGLLLHFCLLYSTSSSQIIKTNENKIHKHITLSREVPVDVLMTAVVIRISCSVLTNGNTHLKDMFAFTLEYLEHVWVYKVNKILKAVLF